MGPDYLAARLHGGLLSDLTIGDADDVELGTERGLRWGVYTDPSDGQLNALVFELGDSPKLYRTHYEAGFHGTYNPRTKEFTPA
jgi:hypothetical protein